MLKSNSLIIVTFKLFYLKIKRISWKFEQFIKVSMGSTLSVWRWMFQRIYTNKHCKRTKEVRATMKSFALKTKCSCQRAGKCNLVICLILLGKRKLRENNDVIISEFSKTEKSPFFNIRWKVIRVKLY